MVHFRLLHFLWTLTSGTNHFSQHSECTSARPVSANVEYKQLTVIIVTLRTVQIKSVGILLLYITVLIVFKNTYFEVSLDESDVHVWSRWFYLDFSPVIIFYFYSFSDLFQVKLLYRHFFKNSYRSPSFYSSNIPFQLKAELFNPSH